MLEALGLMQEPRASRPRAVQTLLSLAPRALLGLAVLSLFWPIASSGIWDPYELRAIDLARRIAVNLFGASDLALDGLANTLPTRGEVDRGELPFTSMALALRVFGPHAWAGRLALALWGALGLAATYVLVARLVDRAAATLSVLVLATMPLYFLHARTMLGDGVVMASIAIALSGFALGLFERGPVWQRALWVALGCLGLLGGALSRGVLLGVAVPALGVGLGWFVPRLAGALRPDAFASWVGGALVVAGLGALGAGVLTLERALAAPERYFALLGFGISPPLTRPTFDAVVHQLGHGLFPWSALLPAAFARFALAAPGVNDEARERLVGLRATILLLVAIALGAWGGVASSAGVLPFGAVAALAIAAALALRDIDLGAPPSRVFGLLASALALMLLFDFKNFPEELFNAFALGPLRFPESFREHGARLLTLGTLTTLVLFLCATHERAHAVPPAFARQDYTGFLRAVRDQWNGNLLFGLLVVEAALLGFLVFDALGQRLPALERFVARGHTAHLAAQWGWLVPTLALLAPLACMAIRDCFRWLDLQRASELGSFLVPRRGSLAAVGFIVFGAVLSLDYYPALARQLSPGETFEAFRRLARPGEPLGMIGSSSVAPYYAGRDVTTFQNTEDGYRWLLAASGRRFLVLRNDALAGLNSRYRLQASPPKNLPILDARSSELLLASNQLRPGERNQNPLDAYLLSTPPRPAHPLDVNLGDQLDVLGWDVTDLDDRPVPHVVPRRQYRFVIYYRAVARLSGSWETFLHIDGFQRRFNGDHKTLGGRYPFALWQVGDLIADRHEIELEPNFTPGTYRVYFGLYAGSRRLPVRRGAHEEDRVDGGGLVVR